MCSSLLGTCDCSKLWFLLPAFFSIYRYFKRGKTRRELKDEFCFTVSHLFYMKDTFSLLFLVFWGDLIDGNTRLNFLTLIWNRIKWDIWVCDDLSTTRICDLHNPIWWVKWLWCHVASSTLLCNQSDTDVFQGNELWDKLNIFMSQVFAWRKGYEQVGTYLIFMSQVTWDPGIEDFRLTLSELWRV